MAADDSPTAPFVLYCSLTLLYGLVNSLTSPALPDLAEQASLTSFGLGSLFIWRGVGSMIGAFTVGAVLDAVRDPHIVLAACLVLRICSGMLMPAGWTFVFVGFDLGAVAFCGNAIYVCGSTSISWTYGKLMGPRVSLMDSAFGVGGCLAPVLAGVLASCGYTAVFGYRAIALVDLALVVMTCSVQAKANPRFAKVAVAPESEEHGYKELKGAELGEADTKVEWFAVILCCGLILFADICFSSVMFWFYSYATQHLGLAPGAARALNTALWAVFTGIQFFWAWLQKHVDAVFILKGIVPFSLVMSASIAIPPSWAGQFAPAAAMVCLGFGGGMNALSTTLLRQMSFIGGTSFGILRIASAFGNMAGGASVGFLEPALGRLALPCVAATGMAIDLALLALMLRMYPPQKR